MLNVDTGDLRRFLGEKYRLLDRIILEELNRSGETLVTDARLGGNYNDYTGNLRSSIGFKVFKEGEEVTMDFQQSPRGTDKETGMQTGEQVVDELGMQSMSSYALVATAGMHYAAVVEANNKDVFTIFAAQAKLKLEKSLKSL